MTLTNGKLILAKDYPADADVKAYVTAVETADGQSLEPAVIAAYDNFIVGCKSDGIWDAIKASCILAGARTLSGALVPLAGTAPTNNNFVSGDYNRKTGLVGNGSNKYLLTNYFVDASIPNAHAGVFVTTRDSSTRVSYISGTGVSGGLQLETGVTLSHRAFTTCLNASAEQSLDYYIVDSVYYGLSRSDLNAYSRSRGSTVTTINSSFVATTDISPAVFAARNSTGVISGYSSARIAFYSIGEALDLAKLDARISTLISDLGAAIP